MSWRREGLEMKLKEKLAKEYSDDTGDETDARGFLAGFERAREMATAKFLTLFTEVGITKVSIEDFESLGEEEVS